jgi:hypothetical protein
MDKLTIQEFGATIKQKYPQYANLTDFEIGQKTLKKFPQYGNNVATTFDVDEVKEDTQTRLTRAQNEAAKAQQEAKKAGSLGGLARNFGKALVENIAPSQVGLGKSVAKIFGNQSETYGKIIGDVNNQQANLLRLIKEKETKGGDTTSLKRLYNDNVKQLRELNKTLSEESELPSAGKVVGQLAGTALDIGTVGTYGKAKTGLMQAGKLAPQATKKITQLGVSAGVPEMARVAGQKASGLFTKKGLANVGVGAGLGYTSDVAMGLQGLRGEDREGGKAFIPGLGTAIGTTIPAISETTQTVKNLTNPELKAQRLVAKRAKGLEALDSYQSIKKATEKGRERGIDIKKRLAETDVLSGAVDKNGTITTKGAGGPIEQYTKDFIDGNENIVSDLLKKENRSVSPAFIKARLLKKIKSAGIEGKALVSAEKSIDDEIAGYMRRANRQGNIPVSTLHDAKIDKYNGINFFTEGVSKKYDKTVAQALKEIVEETTTSAKIKDINRELSKHFAVIDYLERLDNKKVQGGKLGKYFAQTVGAMVGGQVGGPLGAIAGAEIGAGIKGASMAQTFRGKTGKIAPQSEVITEALRVKNAPPLELPYSKSNSLGSLTTNQTNTIAPTNIGISDTIPQDKNIVTQAIEKYKSMTPGERQRGSVKLGALNKKVPEDVKDRAYRYLSDLDVDPPVVNGKIDLSMSDFYFRLGQLKDKINSSGQLTKAETSELIEMLKQTGYDAKTNKINNLQLGKAPVSNIGALKKK